MVTTSADFAQSSISAQDLSSLSDRELFRGQEQGALEELAEQAAQQIYEEAVIPDF